MLMQKESKIIWCIISSEELHYFFLFKLPAFFSASGVTYLNFPLSVL